MRLRKVLTQRMGWTRRVNLTKGRNREIFQGRGKTRKDKEEITTAEVKPEEQSGHIRMSKYRIEERKPLSRKGEIAPESWSNIKRTKLWIS